MKSNRAKVLQRIGGSSMLHKICSTAAKISPKITLVVGFDKDSVIKEADEYGLEMLKPDNCTQQLIVFTGDISNNDHEEIFSLINTIKLSEFWSAQITQVHFEDNDVILIPRVGNHKIKVGDLRGIYEKLDKLYHFYKVVIPTKGWEFYKEINLKYNNQIVCTKK